MFFTGEQNLRGLDALKETERYGDIMISGYEGVFDFGQTQKIHGDIEIVSGQGHVNVLETLNFSPLQEVNGNVTITGNTIIDLIDTNPNQKIKV